MRKLYYIIVFVLFAANTYGQNLQDTVTVKPAQVSADDPSQFFTRVKFFNDLQYHQNENTDFYLNQTILRTVVKIGKRFTVRLDVPYVYNSFSSPADYKQSGLGDISIRLLGYRFYQSPKSAITGSLECSFNSADSPLLGLGKNLLIPMITYSTGMPKYKMLFAFVLLQTNSVSGDENRQDISFTKIQAIGLKFWTQKFWTVLAPEFYFDYVLGGASMNLQARFVYAPVKRVNLWVQPGVGVFGDFAAIYQWKTEVGCRYFFLRNTLIKRKNNG